jgi:hypothetical protein
VYKHAGVSCLQKTNDQTWAFLLIEEGVKRTDIQGDFVYITGRLNTWGVFPSVSIGAGTTSADMQPYFQQVANSTGIQALFASWIELTSMPDDHDGYTGDNFDHTITQANDGNPGTAFTLQTEVDDHFNEGRLTNQMLIDGFWGGNFVNKVNTDPGVGPEKPSSADASTSVNNYPARYWRELLDVNGNPDTENPHSMHIYLDCITHRSPIAAVDNASKTMLGSIQKQWVKDSCDLALSSGCKFVFFKSPKKTYNANSSDNLDTFAVYSTERDEIIDYYDSIGLTGVYWFTGDKHRGHIINLRTDSGDARDHFCIVGCPSSIDLNGNASTIENGIRWWAAGANGTYYPQLWMMTVDEDEVIMAIVDGITGNPIQEWVGTPNRNYGIPL